jgi:hypothetical protein
MCRAQVEAYLDPQIITHSAVWCRTRFDFRGGQVVKQTATRHGNVSSSTLRVGITTSDPSSEISASETSEIDDPVDVE